jgi:hypothetical protein
MRANPRAWSAVALALVVAVVATVLLTSGRGSPGPASEGACVDPGPTVSSLHQFDRSVGGDVHCVMLFDNAATTWQQWAAPWFATNSDPDSNWSAFARAGNRLVITPSMFPENVEHTNWRSAGASGAYDGYARELARNLVRAGMGSATIRLGHEANGTWYADNVGDSAADWARWKQFWRHTVIAMRSVPGAHFSFNWCIAAGPRAIPFNAYYPGDDVVDSIGVDVYDRVPNGYSGNHWSELYGEPGGVGALANFARAHHKPLAIPEWGLERAGTYGNTGPDPTFTRGIVSLLQHNDVAFEGYFFRGGEASALLADRQSLALYRDEVLR